MVYNLTKNKHAFGKLIHFGSGVELNYSPEPYPISKRMIARESLKHDNFFNLRIFGVFDHNELETRFIKGNLLNYINKKPMIIHQNRCFDFIFMSDLILIILQYIKLSNNELLKEINCIYSDVYDLIDIAEYINTLNSYKVPIIVEKSGHAKHYTGEYIPFPKDDTFLLGLEYGITETYHELLNKWTSV